MCPASSRRELLTGLAALATASLLPKSTYAGPQVRSGLQNSAAPEAKAYINFVINVQNFRYLDSSADTVIKLANIFSKFNAKGDFYLTGPMVQLYNASRTDAINKLKGQGVCYHTRPPHPIFAGFDSRLQGLTGSQLTNKIEEFETQQLDLSTGKLTPGKPGGFALVKSSLGKTPSCVSIPSDDDTIREAACAWYKDNGAKAVVWYHKAQKLGDNPYQYKNGLLSRPSDVVVDQWQARGESSPTLWWNRYKDGAPEADGKPHKRIEQLVATWEGKRPPFVTVLIHDDNFTRRGPDPWVYTFWKDKEKTQPKNAPYNLEAEDPSTRRDDEEQTRILTAYNNMVEFCAANYTIVTMNDVLNLASR